MALKFSTTSKAVSQGIKVLVYGPSGVGKTTLLASVPKVIILSAEKGLLSLRHVEIPVILIESFEDLESAYNWLTNPSNSHLFDTIGCDSLSEIGEVVLKKAKQNSKDARLAYMETSDKMIDLIKKFRDIPNKNFIGICKIENLKDEMTGVVKYFPALPGNKLSQKLPYLFDEVLYLGLKTDPATQQTYRFIQSQPDFQVTAKDRSGALAQYEPADLSIVFGKIYNSGVQNG